MRHPCMIIVIINPHLSHCPALIDMIKAIITGDKAKDNLIKNIIVS